MEQDPTVEEMAENRVLAAQMLSNLQDSQKVIFDQQVDLFKWLTASLLVLNGGAVGLVMGNGAIPILSKIQSSALFCLGAILSLLIAVVAQWRGQKSIKPLSKLIGYWMSVVADGVRGEDLEVELNEELSDSVKNSWIVPLIGWFSVLALASGIAVAALGMFECNSGECNPTISVEQT